MNVKATVLAIVLSAAGPALAQPPSVATDIPPVHSLVARVMQGAGEPALILPPGASPHGYAMRPSEAAALVEAQVVIWIGEGLSPQLHRAIETLSSDAVSIELLEVNGTRLLGYRQGASFADHAHAGEEAAHADEEHETGHRDDAGHHEGEHEGGEHAHGATDPHAWLDPENAKLWLGTIAATLSDADPANANLYASNAEQGQAEIDALARELAEMLTPLRGQPFIVFHDAYHYFEHRFGIEAAGAISLGDASSPSAARLAEIRETVRRLDARCVFAEPQFPQALIETVAEGTEARAATLDPLGSGLEPGPGLYPQLMRDLAGALRDCLGSAA